MIEFILVLPGIIWAAFFVFIAIFAVFNAAVEKCRSMTRHEFQRFILTCFLVYLPAIMFVAGISLILFKVEKRERQLNRPMFVEQEEIKNEHSK